MAKVKTRCMFCSMQDSFYLQETPRSEKADWVRESVYYLEFDKEQIRGLCGRGNFCSELAVHPKRLLMARLGWDKHPPKKVAEDLGKKLAGLSGEKVAFLLDGSLTLEDATAVIALAEKLGSRKVALLPVEDVALGPINNDFNFADVAKAVTNVVIGDAFTQSPTITRLVHDANLLGRNHTIVGIDPIPSRTGWFAHPELNPPLGKTLQFIEALTSAVKGTPISELPLDDFGVSADNFGWAVSAIKGAEGNGNVIFAPGWHFEDPHAIAVAAKELAKASGFKFGALTIGTNSRGIFRLLASAGMDYAGTIEALYKGNLDAVVAFDCDPMSALPGIKLPEIFGLTGQISTEGYDSATHFIPTCFMFEKRGTLFGTENDFIELEDGMPSPGTFCVNGIIDYIAGEKISVPSNLRDLVANYEHGDEAPIATAKVPENDLIGVGHGHVFHHGDGRYTRHVDFSKVHVPAEVDSALISPELAESVGLKKDDRIKVSSGIAQAELGIILQDWVDSDKVLLPMHWTAVRELFDFSKNPTATPIEIKIEKA